ncbi:MAG: SDR family NAD(P)-dependent oxidoreductase [Acidimicrobiales bacterium]
MAPSAPTAVVTGANSGIGLETARGLLHAGFRVVLLCRSAARAEAARADLLTSQPGAAVDIVQCDLGLQAEVRRAATEIGSLLDRLDVLVNNAGITIRSREVTTEGHDVMLAVNHLGPFLLTNLLLPLLEASAPARIVNLASDAHKVGKLRLDDLEGTRGYGLLGFPRYGETKLMNILFTRELARRLAGTGVTANAVHPGGVRTNLGAPPKLVGAAVGLFLKPPDVGARTSITVATAPKLETVSGGYFARSRRADQKLSAAARDDAAAMELWERSAQLVSLAT